MLNFIIKAIILILLFILLFTSSESHFHLKCYFYENTGKNNFVLNHL